WCEGQSGKWSARYVTEVRRLCEKDIIPAEGSRRLPEMTRADWIEIIQPLRQRTPAKAHWLYTIFSSFLNYSEAAGWIAVNPLPRRGRDKIAPAVAPRARALDDVELVKLWQASETLSAKSRLFCRLLILTGARESEAAGIAIRRGGSAARAMAHPGGARQE